MALPALSAERWTSDNVDATDLGIMQPPFSALISRTTLTHPHCDTTIIGTYNSLHLAEKLAAVAEGPLLSELHDQIASRVAALDN